MHQSGDKHQAPRNSGGLRADWQKAAACRDYGDYYLDPWDADPNVGVVNQTAHAICRRCPVKRECLIAGLESDAMNKGVAFGIWGDTTPKQRRAMVRLRYRLWCPVCRGKLLITAEGEEWQACASCGITWRCRKAAEITELGPVRCHPGYWDADPGVGGGLILEHEHGEPGGSDVVGA